jgi:hypothetical protein
MHTIQLQEGKIRKQNLNTVIKILLLQNKPLSRQHMKFMLTKEFLQKAIIRHNQKGANRPSQNNIFKKDIARHNQLS